MYILYIEKFHRCKFSQNAFRRKFAVLIFVSTKGLDHAPLLHVANHCMLKCKPLCVKAMVVKATMPKIKFGLYTVLAAELPHQRCVLYNCCISVVLCCECCH